MRGLFYIFSCSLRLVNATTKEEVCVNPAPNSAFTQRTIFLLLGKESRENVDYLKVLEPECVKLENDGLMVMDNKIYVKVATKNLCIDRKDADLWTGLGGSYCDFC